MKKEKTYLLHDSDEELSFGDTIENVVNYENGIEETITCTFNPENVDMLLEKGIIVEAEEDYDEEDDTEYDFDTLEEVIDLLLERSARTIEYCKDISNRLEALEAKKK